MTCRKDLRTKVNGVFPCDKLYPQANIAGSAACSRRSRQNPTLISLGDTIRRLRRERGISQEALALLAEVDRSYVGRVEHDDNNVAFQTPVKLTAALQITVPKLMKEVQL